MAGGNDGGDKTEKPTPKRLKDARKKGDVPKSRDITSAAGLVVWLLLAATATGFATTRIGTLYDRLFGAISEGWTRDGFAVAVRSIGWQAAELALTLSAMLLIPAVAIGVLVEFLQAGPVLTFEKLTPNLDKMNPVEGVKRMFSMDNLIEVFKGIAKASLLAFVGWLAARSALPDMVSLVRSSSVSPAVVLALIGHLTIKVMSWSVGIFALVSILDFAYQRYSFEKKMRMSIRDIKKEMKDSEGDPHIKHQRKQAHQEWSQRNAAQAARNANVLLVNPTHVAIAIDYDGRQRPKRACPSCATFRWRAISSPAARWATSFRQTSSTSSPR
jgi:flagellar biosynthetic protein FlhB/type III secretion protein U